MLKNLSSTSSNLHMDSMPSSECSTFANQSIFSQDDLAKLQSYSDVPGKIRSALESLVEFALQEPDYPNANPQYGRFALTSYSQSVVDNRAAFRVLRAAIDFLEADYVACETEELQFWRGEVETVEKAREVK